MRLWRERSAKLHTNDQLAHLKEQSRETPLSRRDFVSALSLATAAGPGLVTAALTGFSLTSSQRSEAMEAIVDGMGKLPQVRFGTRMGKMMVAPICISQDWSRELLAPALDMGVNFIHKAGYWGNLPDEIKKLPRESYYTDITVDNTSPGHNPDNYDEAYGQVTQSLEKNGLKYYDVYRAHYGWHTPDKVQLANNTSYKAFLKLKKEGKVKYFGVSQHPYAPDANGSIGERIPQYAVMTQACIDSGIVDCMQVWFSYNDDYTKEVRDSFAKASKAGIGMTAMKINAHGRGKMEKDVAKQEEMKAKGMVGRSLIREVMTTKRSDGKPIFHTCVSALRNMDTFEENVGGVSPKVALLDGFDRLHFGQA